MKRKFFVSSTFKDFHSERDLLMHEVIPAFRAEARKHGDEVDSVDLRWGLDNFGLDERGVVYKVLSVCFEEIENSRLIIFIGSRWGWIPNAEFVPEKFAEKIAPVEGQSVTALEIKYGLNQNANVIICIRKEIRGDVPDAYLEENPCSSQKLDALKKDLYKNHGASIIEYTADFNSAKGTLENLRTEKTSLAEAILAKMREDCKADWSRFENLPWQSRELEAADNFAKGRADSFVERQSLVSELKGKIEDSRAVFLRGVPGAGKTSIACKIAAELRGEGKRVCNIFCGTSPLTSNAQSILRLMIYFLAPEYNSAGDSFQDLKTRLINLCREISEPVYFIIDAVEMLDADAQSNNLEFLPTQSENIHCLVTCADDFEIAGAFFDPAEYMKATLPELSDDDILEIISDSLGGENLEEKLRDGAKELVDKFFGEVFSNKEREDLVQEFLIPNAADSFRQIPEKLSEVSPIRFLREEIPPLAREEITPILARMLEPNGRTLYQPTAAAILKKPNSANPLYLEMTAQMLNMIAAPELTRLRTPEEIVPLTVDFIEKMPDDLEDAAVFIIGEAMTRLEILNRGKLVEALNLLAVSRHGLRMSDLQAILKDSLNPLDWARVQKFLHNFFIERQNGQIDFAHKIFRAGILEIFTRLERKLAAHIEELSGDDSIRDAEGIFYAQKFKNYKLAATLFAEAYTKKNSALICSIRDMICADGGDFCVEIFEQWTPDLDEKIIAAMMRFFLEDLQGILAGDSADNLNAGVKIFNALADAIGEKNLPYHMAKMNAAAFENMLGNFESVKTTCEEIVGWGEENLNLENAFFCHTLAVAYNLLGKIAQDAADFENEKKYTERSIEFYEVLRGLDEVNAEMHDSLIRSLRNVLQRFQPPDEVLENLLSDYRELREKVDANPDNPLFLSMMISACTSIAYNYSKQGRFDAALAIALENETYARELLARDANNADFAKILGLFLGELSFAEFNLLELDSEEKVQRAHAHSFEALTLLNQVYFKNPTPENLRNLQELSGRLIGVAQGKIQDLLDDDSE